MAANDWRAKNLAELRQIWDDLRPDAPQGGVARSFRGQVLSTEEGGDVFERWVMEAFRLSGVPCSYGFQVPMADSGNTREQIDGMIYDGWQGFLIESKFWTGKVDFGPIALLQAILVTRPIGTVGLFFSLFGYTRPASVSAALLRPVRILLFDLGDFQWALGVRSFKGHARDGAEEVDP